MSDEPLPNSEFILYQTEDGRTRVPCRFEDDTLWLTQVQIPSRTVDTLCNTLLAKLLSGELSVDNLK